MTYRQAAMLACRILAIVTLLGTLDSLGTLIVLVTNTLTYANRGATYPLWTELPRYMIPAAVQLALGIWLWKRAGIIAVWMTGAELQDAPDEPESDPKRAGMAEFQAVVLSSLGVWVLLQVVPQILAMIFQTLLTWIMTRQLVRTGGGVDSRIWMWSFQLLLGLWLIFGAAGITCMLRRARGESTSGPLGHSDDNSARIAR